MVNIVDILLTDEVINEKKELIKHYNEIIHLEEKNLEIDSIFKKFIDEILLLTPHKENNEWVISGEYKIDKMYASTITDDEMFLLRNICSLLGTFKFIHEVNVEKHIININYHADLNSRDELEYTYQNIINNNVRR